MTQQQQQQLRNRKKKNTKTKSTDSSIENREEGPQENDEVAESTVNNDVELEGESLWQTFKSHPLIRIAPFILIPYLVFRAYFFFRLQHPEYIGNGWLRPAVGLTEERQLLIVGVWDPTAMAAVALSLSHQFGLEVATQASDTQWFFARDATVSWFHGIRFVPPSRTVDPLATLCVNYTKGMGFHPQYYRSNSGCSSRVSWDKCWAKECWNLLNREWGCALVTNDGFFDMGTSCETPFRRILHQVRHPLQTVKKLVNTFCVNGMDGELTTSFRNVIPNIFPSLTDQDSCIEAIVKYVLEYTQTMIHARKEGLIAGMYHVETTSPCHIVEMAGFTTQNEVVYGPHFDKILSVCSQPFHMAKAPIDLSITEKEGEDKISLGWNDLRGGVHRSNRTDDDLLNALKALTLELGYDLHEPSTVSEF